MTDFQRDMSDFLHAVFHVTDQQGNKIQEGDVLDNIEKVVKFSYVNSLQSLKDWI